METGCSGISPPNLLIVLYSMEQFLLSIGVGYGNRGLLQNAKFFFGSPSGTGDGQQTDLQGEAFRIRPSVHHLGQHTPKSWVVTDGTLI
jgi:hypothetical protein